MRREFPAAKVSWVHLIILIGVLASLCFSVGEGLRLLPLPHPPSPPGERVDASPRMTTPSASTLNQFQTGSITQPPQAQKTLKRKQAQWASTSLCGVPLPNSLRLLCGAQRRAGFYLTELSSRRAGRAPPPTA